jgi:drug/metabolite transporter (DMT)-like permease
MQTYIIITLTLFSALIASLAQLLFKKKLPQKATMKTIIRAVFTPSIILGLVGYGASLAVYLYALSSADLSIVYPIFASSFIFTTILSAIVLKEKISARRAAGIVLIFIGVSIIALSI